MISNEERSKRPYALPIQCIPYKGLSDAKVRDLVNKIISEMVKRKMKVAGKKVYVNVLLWINSIRIYNGWGMELPPYQGKHKAIISVSSLK